MVGLDQQIQVDGGLTLFKGEKPHNIFGAWREREREFGYIGGDYIISSS